MTPHNESDNNKYNQRKRPGSSHTTRVSSLHNKLHSTYLLRISFNDFFITMFRVKTIILAFFAFAGVDATFKCALPECKSCPEIEQFTTPGIGFALEMGYG
jgi:hypothetical protein